MNKIVTISDSFSPDIGLFFKSKVNLYIDKLSLTNKEHINILWLCEPDSISKLKKDLNNFEKEYDYILTFDEDILREFKNSVMHLQASSWVEDKEYSPKNFNISTIVGSKMQAQGHILRQKVWHKQSDIKIPKNFYISSFGCPLNHFDNPPLEGGKKECMFYSQFHIAVENCSIKNYFSEKILDCFISKTIPVYYGCTNIEDFFNIKGIITFDKVSECIDKCNSLNEDDYEKMLPYVEENYKKAKQFLNWDLNLINTIKQLNIE
jgi:hypothetical protein